jgi:hypothetical protein
METSEIFALLFIISNFVVYFLRDRFPFDKIWFVLKAFWTALLLVLVYNNIKDRFNKKP